MYLYLRKKNFLYTAVPMVFMLVTTLIAMVSNVRTFFSQGNHLLLVVGAAVLVLAVWLIIEGVLRFTRGREEAVAGLKEALN
jgi:carbon starvation protein